MEKEEIFGLFIFDKFNQLLFRYMNNGCQNHIIRLLIKNENTRECFKELIFKEKTQNQFLQPSIDDAISLIFSVILYSLQNLRDYYGMEYHRLKLSQMDNLHLIFQSLTNQWNLFILTKKRIRSLKFEKFLKQILQILRSQMSIPLMKMENMEESDDWKQLIEYTFDLLWIFINENYSNLFTDHFLSIDSSNRLNYNEMFLTVSYSFINQSLQQIINSALEFAFVTYPKCNRIIFWSSERKCIISNLYNSLYNIKQSIIETLTRKLEENEKDTIFSLAHLIQSFTETDDEIDEMNQLFSFNIDTIESSISDILQQLCIKKLKIPSMNKRLQITNHPWIKNSEVEFDPLELHLIQSYIDIHRYVNDGRKIKGPNRKTTITKYDGISQLSLSDHHIDNNDIKPDFKIKFDIEEKECENEKEEKMNEELIDNNRLSIKSIYSNQSSDTDNEINNNIVNSFNSQISQSSLPYRTRELNIHQIDKKKPVRRFSSILMENEENIQMIKKNEFEGTIKNIFLRPFITNNFNSKTRNIKPSIIDEFYKNCGNHTELSLEEFRIINTMRYTIHYHEIYPNIFLLVFISRSSATMRKFQMIQMFIQTIQNNFIILQQIMNQKKFLSQQFSFNRRKTTEILRRILLKNQSYFERFTSLLSIIKQSLFRLSERESSNFTIDMNYIYLLFNKIEKLIKEHLIIPQNKTNKIELKDFSNFCQINRNKIGENFLRDCETYEDLFKTINLILQQIYFIMFIKEKNNCFQETVESSISPMVATLFPTKFTSKIFGSKSTNSTTSNPIDMNSNPSLLEQSSRSDRQSIKSTGTASSIIQFKKIFQATNDRLNFNSINYFIKSHNQFYSLQQLIQLKMKCCINFLETKLTIDLMNNIKNRYAQKTMLKRIVEKKLHDQFSMNTVVSCIYDHENRHRIYNSSDENYSKFVQIVFDEMLNDLLIHQINSSYHNFYILTYDEKEYIIYSSYWMADSYGRKIKQVQQPKNKRNSQTFPSNFGDVFELNIDNLKCNNLRYNSYITLNNFIDEFSQKKSNHKDKDPKTIVDHLDQTIFSYSYLSIHDVSQNRFINQLFTKKNDVTENFFNSSFKNPSYNNLIEILKRIKSEQNKILLQLTRELGRSIS
ncbi:hypothetical protein SNEBB_003741 [Seison nebaliae]|nr:hypothetical protein SNEBB_003741 [Seison nebaliae]